MAINEYLLKWLLFPVLISCSSTSASHPSLEEVQEAAALAALAQKMAPYQGYLVWTLDGEQKTSSYWIRGNAASGTIVASQPFVFLPIDGAIWRVQQTEAEVPLCDCQGWMQQKMQGQCPRAQETGRGELPQLIDVTTDQTIEAIPLEELLNEEEPIHANYTIKASLIGSVGPFLFIQLNEEKMPCGSVHKDLATGYYVFDIKKQRLIDILTESEHRRIFNEEQIDAFEQLRSDPNLALTSSTEVELTSIEPTLYPGKGLMLGYQFSSTHSFADSEGNRSSYSRSITIAARQLPQALVPFSQIPETVQKFILLSSEVRVGGWLPIEEREDVSNVLFEIFDINIQAEENEF